MKMQTKASMARVMMSYLIITWMVPMLFEAFHLMGHSWIGIVAAASPLPFLLFIVLINKSLTVKYYTQREFAITMLVVSAITIVARGALAVFPLTAGLFEFVSFIGLVTSLISLFLFCYEALEH